MIKINEALQFSKKNGKEIQKKDLAKKLWPDSAPLTQEVNMSNLISGKTKTIKPEWIEIICEETGVSANELLGIKQ